MLACFQQKFPQTFCIPTRISPDKCGSVKEELLELLDFYEVNRFYHFLVSAQSNFVLLLSSAKTVNKQGYIHASYQVEKNGMF